MPIRERFAHIAAVCGPPADLGNEHEANPKDWSEHGLPADLSNRHEGWSECKASETTKLFSDWIVYLRSVSEQMFLSLIVVLCSHCMIFV